MVKKLIGVSVILVLVGVGLFLFKILPATVNFPQQVKDKVSFPLYYPRGSISPFSVDQKTIKLYQDSKEKDQNGVSFVLVSADNKITISEQQTPDLISEQLGLDKLASTMNAYKEIITSAGRVELTRPKELNGGQTAVAVPNFTTLIFAKPEHDLDENQWRKIFNSLELVR